MWITLWICGKLLIFVSHETVYGYTDINMIEQSRNVSCEAQIQQITINNWNFGLLFHMKHIQTEIVISTIWIIRTCFTWNKISRSRYCSSKLLPCFTWNKPGVKQIQTAKLFHVKHHHSFNAIISKPGTVFHVKQFMRMQDIWLVT